MGMMKDIDIMLHDAKEHVNVLHEEILDTLAQLRHNIRYSGTDDNRTLYNRIRYTVHPHYCSGIVNPPCLVCKVDDLVEQWLYAQGQLWAIGGEQTDHREQWATTYPRRATLYPDMLGETESRWLENRKVFLETDSDQSR
jgi:hypothetical protein